MKYKYIVVDDDPINNMACSQTISKVISGADVTCFEYPAEGHKFIANEYSASQTPTILLLDIHMPSMNVWDFLDAFSHMDSYIQIQFKIYIVSSSIDPRDREKAGMNKFVTDYLPKPLSIDNIKRIAAF